MKKSLILVVAGLLVLSLVASGCGGAPAVDTSKNDFVYAVGTEPTTLDPHFVTDVNTARAVMQLFETLVTWDENSQIAPLLAKSWTVSEDKLTWTFTLQQGVKFHDGAPFNAEAVKYSIDRLVDPAVASPRASTAATIAKVSVRSEYEVDITVKQPSGAFLAQLTSYNLAIVSPKSAAEFGKEFGTHPAGTAPLKLAEWIPGQSLVFEGFADYWGEKTTVNKITYKVVPEDTSRVMMVKTGDADVVVGVPPIQVETLKTDSNVKVVIETGFRTIYVGMNLKHKPFDNPKVRQAINYAIDRQSIITYVLGGIGKMPVGVESTVISNAATDLAPYTYDPAKAKALLAEAGYPNGFKTTFHTPEGRYPMDKQVAEVVQSQLKEVGIDAEIKVLDWGAYQEATTKGEVTRLFLLGKGCPSGDPDFDLSLSFTTGGSMNNSFYSNTTVDALLAQQRVNVDPVSRAAQLHELQRLIHEDAPWAVLYYEEQTMATRADIEGFELYPNEMLSLKYLKRK